MKYTYTFFLPDGRPWRKTVMKDDGETEAMNDLLRRNGFDSVEQALRQHWFESQMPDVLAKKDIIRKAEEIILLHERQKNFIDLIKLVETAEKINQTSLENTP